MGLLDKMNVQVCFLERCDSIVESSIELFDERVLAVLRFSMSQNAWASSIRWLLKSSCLKIGDIIIYQRWRRLLFLLRSRMSLRACFEVECPLHALIGRIYSFPILFLEFS